jgi:hypothetical protein
LIDLTDYYVGGDTGPTHLASFLGKPIVFFSSRKINPPNRWGPFSPYQRIIRKEYPCAYDCNKKCHPEECFSFLNATLLFDTLMQLISDVALKKAKTAEKIKTYHLLHSYRGLALVKENTKIDIPQSWEDNELRIFPFYWKTFYSIRTIRQFLKAIHIFNINVILGPCPFWLKALTFLYLATYKALICPIFVSTFNPSLSVKDLLKLAVCKWQKKTSPFIL